MSFHGKLAYYKFQLQMKVCSFAEPKMQTSVAVGMDNASRSSGGTEITNSRYPLDSYFPSGWRYQPFEQSKPSIWNGMCQDKHYV